jgi:hypothetical protein
MIPAFFAVRILSDASPLIYGCAQVGFHCAHRATVIHLLDPSKLACFPSFGGAPMLVYVRPSNETTDDPSKLARYLFRDGG